MNAASLTHRGCALVLGAVRVQASSVRPPSTSPICFRVQPFLAQAGPTGRSVRASGRTGRPATASVGVMSPAGCMRPSRSLPFVVPSPVILRARSWCTRRVETTPAARLSPHTMPRHVSTCTVAIAAVLLALAVVPNVVGVHAAVANNHLPASKIAWVLVRLPLNPRPYYLFDVSSLESAKAVESGWETCRRWSWLLLVLALVIVGRELLPVARVFGHDDKDPRGDVMRRVDDHGKTAASRVRAVGSRSPATHALMIFWRSIQRIAGRERDATTTGR
jgi:hypothetical protein